MNEATDGKQLLRVLGVAFGIAVLVGGTIGQGILRTPGLVAQGIPDATLILLVWLGGGLFAAIDAMSTVELASSIRKTGGPYAFVGRAFGRRAGLATGIADWFGNAGAIGFVAVVFGEYLHRLGLLTAVPVGGLGVALILAIGAIHLAGTRVSGESQAVGSAIKALMFVALVVALLASPRGEAVATPVATPVAAMGLAGVVAALRGILGTYNGWNGAAYFCEEVRDPGRQIARATFLGIAVVTAIYVMVNIAFLHVLSPAQMAGSKLVAAEAAAHVFGPRADGIVTGISLISLVTAVNAVLMQHQRTGFAIARDSGLAWLATVAANGTPRRALAVTLLLAVLLASVGIYDILLSFTAALAVATGVAVNAAAIALRRREPTLDRPYRMPLFPLPAIFALLGNGAMLILFVADDPVTAAESVAALVVLTALAWRLTRGAAVPTGSPLAVGS